MRVKGQPYEIRQTGTWVFFRVLWLETLKKSEKTNMGGGRRFLLTHPKHAAGTAGAVEAGWDAWCWSCIRRAPLLLMVPEPIKTLEDA